mgnify:CR=1 FL=1
MSETKLTDLPKYDSGLEVPQIIGIDDSPKLTGMSNEHRPTNSRAPRRFSR